MMLFVVRLESLQDLDRLLDTRFCDLDLLEAPRQVPVPLKIAAILVIGGRADAAQCAGSEAGLRMFEASIEPPLVAPAPTMVWISSMNRTAPGCFLRAFSTAFKRSSNWPRNLVPANTAPMSRE